MGKKNIVWNHYLRNKKRFADVINVFLYQGSQVVLSEELEDLSTIYAGWGTENDGKSRKRIERMRDIRMRAGTGETYCLYAIENQQGIDYSMPFRCMQYDTMEYGRQLEEIRNRNHEEKQFLNNAEWLCKMKKSDRLSPIYTICLYHGEEKWDGLRSLKDMMDFGEAGNELSQIFADYPLRLFCLNERTDYSKFQTEVKKVFYIMQFQKDKEMLRKELENNPEYAEVDPETAEAMSVMVEAPEIWARRERYMRKEEGGGINMCQAMREIREDAREAGRAEGRLESIRKIMKNMKLTAVEALNLLEIPVEEQEIFLQKLH